MYRTNSTRTIQSATTNFIQFQLFPHKVLKFFHAHANQTEISQPRHHLPIPKSAPNPLFAQKPNINWTRSLAGRYKIRMRKFKHRDDECLFNRGREQISASLNKHPRSSSLMAQCPPEERDLVVIYKRYIQWYFNFIFVSAALCEAIPLSHSIFASIGMKLIRPAVIL